MNRNSNQSCMEFFKLSNGVHIPCIGTGPSSIERRIRWSRKGWIERIPLFGHYINSIIYYAIYYNIERQWIKNLSKSLKMGYRLIDYSSAYGNERLISKAIKKSGVDRKDLFIISRASNKDQYNHKVRESFMRSLKSIGVDYLDLYMFHWPVTEHYIETYKEIEKLYKEGLIKAIGICNCHQHHIERILEECEIKPMVNEFEVHPLLTQEKLVQYCKSKGIQIIAYTPLAKNDDRLRYNTILRKLASKYNKNIQQIILKWDIQNCIIPIPYSFNVEHNRLNIDIFDFELSESEMQAIASININSRLRYDPDNCDFTVL